MLTREEKLAVLEARQQRDPIRAAVVYALPTWMRQVTDALRDPRRAKVTEGESGLVFEVELLGFLQKIELHVDRAQAIKLVDQLADGGHTDPATGKFFQRMTARG
jgi:hypothetical protein